LQLGGSGAPHRCIQSLFSGKFFAKVLETPSGAKDVVKITAEIPVVHDLQARLRLIDRFKKYSQILSLPLPPVDTLVGPDRSPELARIGNDGMAELVIKYPDHFAGYVASLPMNAPEAAANEAERVLAAGANGLQIYTNVNGAPLDESRFLPIFEVATKSNRPVMLHPVGFPNAPDYPTESRSKYEIWHVLGWPYQTSVAMARLVFSGVMDRFPELKIVVHHLGAMIPYFAERAGSFWEYRCARTADEEFSSAAKRLKKRPADQFKRFYADTALCGARGATICGLEYYGPDHLLFASDCPFDPENGPGWIRDGMAILGSLDIAPEDREKICYRNAERLFGLRSR
jgi:predicted TIM-barrel fold metal-dependent hydrolase